MKATNGSRVGRVVRHLVGITSDFIFFGFLFGFFSMVFLNHKFLMNVVFIKSDS